MNLDAGTVAELVANGLAVVVLWLGLRSQTRQGQIYAKAILELVAALETHCEDAQREDDVSATQTAKITLQNGRGEHG